MQQPRPKQPPQDLAPGAQPAYPQASLADIQALNGLGREKIHVLLRARVGYRVGRLLGAGHS